MRVHQPELTIAWDGISKAECASMSLGSLTCTSLSSAMAVIFQGLLSWSLLSTGWSVISSSSVTLCSLHSYLLLSPDHWQAHNQIEIRCVTGLGTIYHRAMEKEHNKARWGHSSSALSNHHSTFPPLREGYSVFSLSKNTCNLHFYLRVQTLFHIWSSSITFYKKHSLIYFYAATSANSLRDIGYFFSFFWIIYLFI